MNYPASGRWPEPNTLWLSAAFLGDDAFDTDGAIHMYPEERPSWCAIDEAGCTSDSLTYMGGEHACVVREEDPRTPMLILGGRAGAPSLDPAAMLPVPPTESFRLRGVAPLPDGLPGSATLAQPQPEWVERGGPVSPYVSPLPEGSDFRVRAVEIRGVPIPVSVFEVADPTAEDGCDPDSPRSSLCGGVLWPGARCAAEALARWPVASSRVIEIGAGTGLVSMVAAILGADDALATDASTATLELIEAASSSQDLHVRTAVLDLLDGNAPFPESADIVVAADLLYNEELSRAVARACARLAKRGAGLIVTDSQVRWRAAFSEELASCLGVDEAAVQFEERALGAVTGWSYADGADATYEVRVAVLEVHGNIKPALASASPSGPVV